MTLPTLEDRAAGRAPGAFIVFLALMTSIVALTIDAVLPALDAVAADLGFAEPNDRQLLIFLVFAGLGCSQIIFGPLSDAIGRRPAAMIGWAVYVAGTLVCLVAWTPAMVFLGRFLQGFGAGGPRIVAMAVVRDLYEGRAMARILSLVLTIFMIVPMIAPLIGQGLEALGGWRAIFAVYLAMAVVSGGWYLAGVPETLAPAARRPLSIRPLAAAIAEVLSTRASMAYAGAAVCTFGPFVVFLGLSQQVLEDLYGLGDVFPLAFGALALAFAAATLANSRLVMRFGMRPLSRLGLVGLTLVGGIGMVFCHLGGGVPGLWTFLGLMALIFLCVGILFSNLSALALQPLGHLAGTASAVVMSVTTLGAAPVGYLIASRFDGSLMPMFAGFTSLGILGGLCVMLAGDTAPPRAPAALPPGGGRAP